MAGMKKNCVDVSLFEYFVKRSDFHEVWTGSCYEDDWAFHMLTILGAARVGLEHWRINYWPIVESSNVLEANSL
jgi:hypothetical protein